MPTINVNDAYILDETGAEVDKATGLFTKNENATTGEKQMARLNIAAGGSNPNLLDNAYFVGGGSQLGDGHFPINQRGQTSYTGTGASSIDRWRLSNGNTSISLSASGMTIYTNGSGYGYGGQNLETEFALDGTYTFSVLLADGTLYSTPTNQNLELPSGLLFYFANNKSVNWRNPANTTCETIAAMKLEKGTVSTLANDTPPDFGDELQKCQRYLWHKTFGGNTQIGCGPAIDASTAIIDVVMPASMRATPTITFTANVLLVGNGGVVIDASVAGINEYDNHLRLVISATGLTAYQVYSFLTTTTTTMTVSAEL